MEYYIFFFQAEDGIRDYKVTGVQTCALPISLRLPRAIGPAEQVTYDGLHPLRKRGKAFAQVGADGCTMNWILQNSDEAREDSILFSGQHVAHPIIHLIDVHGRTPASG